MRMNHIDSMLLQYPRQLSRPPKIKTPPSLQNNWLHPNLPSLLRKFPVMKQNQHKLMSLALQPGTHPQNMPLHPPKQLTNTTNRQFHPKKPLIIEENSISTTPLGTTLNHFRPKSLQVLQ